MALIKFDLGTLKDLDGGRVAAAFQHALQRAVVDCEDRPGEKKARKVVLEAEVIPIAGPENSCDGTNVTFRVKDTIPTRTSRQYAMGIREGKDGKRLIFNNEDPASVHQYGFGDINPTTGRVERSEPQE